MPRTGTERPPRRAEPATIASAKPRHVVSPAFTQWNVPVGASASVTRRRAITASAAARSAAEVGQPCWSSTTVSASRSAASRSIVLTKLPRCGLTTQAVRTIAWRGLPVRTASSPAALLAP
jgi:hypothetical protein